MLVVCPNVLSRFYFIEDTRRGGLWNCGEGEGSTRGRGHRREGSTEGKGPQEAQKVDERHKMLSGITTTQTTELYCCPSNVVHACTYA